MGARQHCPPESSGHHVHLFEKAEVALEWGVLGMAVDKAT